MLYSRKEKVRFALAYCVYHMMPRPNKPNSAGGERAEFFEQLKAVIDNSQDTQARHTVIIVMVDMNTKIERENRLRKKAKWVSMALIRQ